MDAGIDPNPDGYIFPTFLRADHCDLVKIGRHSTGRLGRLTVRTKNLGAYILKTDRYFIVRRSCDSTRRSRAEGFEVLVLVARYLQFWSTIRAVLSDAVAGSWTSAPSAIIPPRYVGNGPVGANDCVLSMNLLP